MEFDWDMFQLFYSVPFAILRGGSSSLLGRLKDGTRPLPFPVAPLLHIDINGQRNYSNECTTFHWCECVCVCE